MMNRGALLIASLILIPGLRGAVPSCSADELFKDCDPAEPAGRCVLGPAERISRCTYDDGRTLRCNRIGPGRGGDAARLMDAKPGDCAIFPSGRPGPRDAEGRAQPAGAYRLEGRRWRMCVRARVEADDRPGCSVSARIPAKSFLSMAQPPRIAGRKVLVDASGLFERMDRPDALERKLDELPRRPDRAAALQFLKTQLSRDPSQGALAATWLLPAEEFLVHRARMERGGRKAKGAVHFKLSDARSYCLVRKSPDEAWVRVSELRDPGDGSLPTAEECCSGEESDTMIPAGRFFEEFLNGARYEVGARVGGDDGAEVTLRRKRRYREAKVTTEWTGPTLNPKGE